MLFLLSALHDLDPVFRSYSRSSKAKEVLEAIGLASPTPVQSMYICKVGLVSHHASRVILHLLNVRTQQEQFCEGTIVA